MRCLRMKNHYLWEMWPWLQVLLGGAIGSLLRFSLAEFISLKSTGTFPWAVFSVNIIGSFMIGLLAAYSLQNENLASYRFLIIVGLLGGFTTYSSFALESLELIQTKAWTHAVLYIGGTNLFGLISVYIGYQLISWIR